MYTIKSFIQTLGNLWPSIYLRNLLGVLPKYYREPPLGYAVSDLFLWRSDEVWRTRFDLLNLPSVLYPKNIIEDKVSLIFYDQEGQKICDENLVIPPFQKREIQVEDILGNTKGFGSMAYFHEGLEENSQQVLPQFCIVERGFAAYRRVLDDSLLWSYIHGAAYLLAKSPGKGEFQSTRRLLGKQFLYQPQLLFSDCDRFDLIYINPNDCDSAIKVRAFDRSLNLIREKSSILPPRGVKIFSLENENRGIHRIENESQAYMWRPLISKYYKTHFDIFHG